MEATASAYVITIRETATEFNCKPQEFLLHALVRLGRKGIPVGCRNGGCGVCKVKIHAGDYTHGKMSRAHISAQDEQAGVVLACRCQPSSHLSIEVIGPMRKATNSLNCQT
ncbi:MAG: 2Fe-2S iron-sulfur cluster binding domain-containing protein [Thiolinea sp.]